MKLLGELGLPRTIIDLMCYILHLPCYASLVPNTGGGEEKRALVLNVRV